MFFFSTGYSVTAAQVLWEYLAGERNLLLRPLLQFTVFLFLPNSVELVIFCNYAIFAVQQNRTERTVEEYYENILVNMAREIHIAYENIPTSIILMYIFRSYNLGYTLGHVDGSRCSDNNKVVKVELE